MMSAKRDTTGRLQLAALLILCVAAFLLGGGSRADIASLIFLRPISFAILAFALWQAKRGSWRSAGVPFWLVLAIFVLALAQLVPLPPSVSEALPGRELQQSVLAAAGMADQWRPLTLSPSRTTNALLSLGVPLAALALCSLSRPIPRRVIVWTLLAGGLATSVLSLGQLLGPRDGPLYFYRLTNEGLPVGLFANRNHNAIFLAALLPLAAWIGLFGSASVGRGNSTFRQVGAVGFILFAFAIILLSGSRNGAVLACIAAGAIALLSLLERSANLTSDKGALGKKVVRWHRFAPLLFLGGFAGIAIAAYLTSRSLAFDRFACDSFDTSLRAALLPYLADLAVAYFPAGSGFGTFYQVYQVIEPTELLQPAYVNQAHNDPLQFVIEGGLAGIAILLAGIGWFAVQGWRCFSEFRLQVRTRDHIDPALFAWLSLAFLLAASIFEYPLRVPSLMLVASMLTVVICNGGRGRAIRRRIDQGMVSERPH